MVKTESGTYQLDFRPGSTWRRGKLFEVRAFTLQERNYDFRRAEALFNFFNP